MVSDAIEVIVETGAIEEIAANAATAIASVAVVTTVASKTGVVVMNRFWKKNVPN